MGKVISVINMKGGVGKTTLCLGIGEYLAHYHDKKVLFIDLDPQFNLTQTMMNEFNLEDEYMSDYSQESQNKTVKRLFETPTTLTKRISDPTPEQLILQLDENIDIILGTIDLILVDSDNDGVKSKKVRKFINNNNLKDKYDFIFIDCPPTITVYTNAAIIASDYYLVPNRIDRYSILGIQLLKQAIDRICDNEEIDIKPLGIVYTMMKKPTKKMQELKETFENTEIVNEMGLFSAYTKDINDLLVGYQGNISSNYKKSRADIENICDELLGRI